MRNSQRGFGVNDLGTPQRGVQGGLGSQIESHEGTSGDSKGQGLSGKEKNIKDLEKTKNHRELNS